MGVVYKARDPLIDRLVAVKMISLPPQLADAQKKEYALRFLHEAKAAGNLHHPGIVTVFDVGEEDGLPYMAMEYIEGKSLAQLIKESRVLPVEQALEIARQVADALGYAHRSGVVHRDIKPDNILLHSDGRVVISDFGVARLQTSDLTRTGEILGTPHFMSPEQVLGETVDGRSDLFSLGVVLYLMVTGERPIQGDTISSICYQIVHEEPRSLPETGDLLPEIAAILKRLLAKDPAERFATGDELAEALDVALDPTLSVDGTGVPPEGFASGTAVLEPARAVRVTDGGSSDTAAGRRSAKRTMGLLLGAGAVFIVVAGIASFFVASRLGPFIEKAGGPGKRGAPAGQNVEPMKAPPEPPAGGPAQAVPASPPPYRSGEGRAKSPEASSHPAQAGQSPGASSKEEVGSASKTPSSAAPEDSAKRPAKEAARVGLIVEGSLPRGVFGVFVNGRLEFEQRFVGRPDLQTGDLKHFRITRELRVPAGRHQVKFVVASPRPTRFYASKEYDLETHAGREVILKIEPRRFPARLKITEIPGEAARPGG